MVIDTIFICFCEDCELNDGISKEYYMSKGLRVSTMYSKINRLNECPGSFIKLRHRKTITRSYRNKWLFCMYYYTYFHISN